MTEITEPTENNPSMQIVRMVAEAKDKKKDELPPLAREYDPEALNRMVKQGASVHFGWCGCHIGVNENHVQIRCSD